MKIERFNENPLLVPNAAAKWMSKNLFNCGVIITGDGVWKMLVRGAHTDGQAKSDLGLALSIDGVNWNLLTKPVLRCSFNKHCTLGIEDPRIIKWNGWHYIFATVSSIEGGRVGIWKTKNFLDYEWVGIPFEKEDKNASIFPEVIDKWVYLLHRKGHEHIWISRTRDLSLKTGWQGDHILIKKDRFYRHPDHKVLPAKIGIAGPPIRTPKGWLVLTHVVHRYDPKITKYSFLIYRSYSLSFMVLDLDDPTKVIYIHPEPILWPEERCEVAGVVPNVVFSCATVDPGGEFFCIYWGGADTVICGGRLYKKDLPMCF